MKTVFDHLKDCNFICRELMTMKSVFATLKLCFVSSEAEIDAFQFCIHLGLKTKDVRCCKGNIRVISVHSRGKC